jgi:6-phosphogluconolactonase
MRNTSLQDCLCQVKRRAFAPRIALAALAVVLAPSCSVAASFVYVGTQGDSIWLARLDDATGALTMAGPAAKVTRPTWVTVDAAGRHLFAVSEVGNAGEAQGAVLSFAIDPARGALRPINRVPSGGGGATFVSYDARARAAFVGNFGGGQVAAIPVGGDGTLAPPTSVVTDTGKGPSRKQDMPHAHQTLLDPSGHVLLVPDMGADRVFLYRYDPSSYRLAAGDPAWIQTPPATGPRHIALSADGRLLYALMELTAEVRVYRRAGGRWSEVQVLAIDPPGTPPEKRSAGEVNLAPDGRFLYVSNRIRSTIDAFAIDPRSGRIRAIQEQPTGGSRPRSFAIDPSGRWMVVGNQDSSEMTTLAIDRRTGRLGTPSAQVPVPGKPVSFAFYPAP